MLVSQGVCAKIRIERPGDAARSGDVLDAKFLRQWVPGQSGIAELDAGEQCLLSPLPGGLTEGRTVRIRIVRSAMREQAGQAKRALARPAEPGTALMRGPDLLEQIDTDDVEIRQVAAHDADLLGAHGWHEIVEQAETGRVAFAGGTLLVSPTPAMTVIDVDGTLPAAELAKKSAGEVARLLSRLDITGSVAIDFPTLESRASRAEALAEFDQNMTENCERTAINGFGLMQVVSRKTGPSVLELLQSNRTISAALQLLRLAERTVGTGLLVLELHPAVATCLRSEDSWLYELQKRTGRPVELRTRGELPIHGGLASSG